MVAGLVLAVTGWFGVLAAESAMSRSWRIGVDRTSGPNWSPPVSSDWSATPSSPR
jgi:hypothetical protein